MRKLAKQTGFMNIKELRQVLEKTLGKNNFLLISSGGRSKIKPVRVVGKFVPINPKPKVQVVDFVDERRTRL